MSERMYAAVLPKANAIKCISFMWHIMISIYRIHLLRMRVGIWKHGIDECESVSLFHDITVYSIICIHPDTKLKTDFYKCKQKEEKFLQLTFSDR